jgi:hypothetical protein
MELLDDGNNVVDQLATGFDDSQVGFDWNDTVEALYYRAKQKALRLDELASALLADVDEGREPAHRELPPPPSRGSAETTELDDLPF